MAGRVRFVEVVARTAARLAELVVLVAAFPLSHSPGWSPPGSDPAGWMSLPCPYCPSITASRRAGRRFHCRDCDNDFPAVLCTCRKGMARGADGTWWVCTAGHRQFVARLCPECGQLSSAVGSTRYACARCGEFDVNGCRECDTGFAAQRPDGRWVCERTGYVY